MSKAPVVSVEAIEALLPQIQCERCSYPGCAPYAQAIHQGLATINLCSPGGEPTMRALAALTGQPEAPVVSPVAHRYKAVIQENECIGCTKCIQVCPVDAIIGAQGLMHSVLEANCTGCELCIEACPMMCISMSTEPGVPWVVEQGATESNISFAILSQNNVKKRHARLNATSEKNHATPNLAPTKNSSSSIDLKSLLEQAQRSYQPKEFKVWKET